METRDWIAIGALVVSGFALLVAALSARYTRAQYQLNEDRDLREREARYPTFDHEPLKQQEGRLWLLKIGVLNRNDAKLTFDFIAIEAPDGAKLALPGGAGGHLNPVGAITNFIAPGVAPHATATWTGYIFIEDQFPGGRGKRATLVYAFRSIDAPDTQIELKFTVSLP